MAKNKLDTFPSKSGNKNGFPDYVFYENENSQRIIAVGDVNYQNTPAPTGGAIIEGNVIIGATGDTVFPSTVPIMPSGSGASPQSSLTVSRKSKGRVFEFRQDFSETTPIINSPASTNARIYYGDSDASNVTSSNFGPSNWPKTHGFNKPIQSVCVRF